MGLQHRSSIAESAAALTGKLTATAVNSDAKELDSAYWCHMSNAAQSCRISPAASTESRSLPTRSGLGQDRIECLANFAAQHMQAVPIRLVVNPAHRLEVGGHPASKERVLRSTRSVPPSSSPIH